MPTRTRISRLGMQPSIDSTVVAHKLAEAISEKMIAAASSCGPREGATMRQESSRKTVVRGNLRGDARVIQSSMNPAEHQ